METYAGKGLADFESGLLPGETEGGSLWLEKKKKFKGLEIHQADGAPNLQGVGNILVCGA